MADNPDFVQRWSPSNLWIMRRMAVVERNVALRCAICTPSTKSRYRVSMLQTRAKNTVDKYHAYYISGLCAISRLTSHFAVHALEVRHTNTRSA
jgi:hypothetical protein